MRLWLLTQKERSGCVSVRPGGVAQKQSMARTVSIPAYLPARRCKSFHLHLECLHQYTVKEYGCVSARHEPS